MIAGSNLAEMLHCLCPPSLAHHSWFHIDRPVELNVCVEGFRARICGPGNNSLLQLVNCGCDDTLSGATRSGPWSRPLIPNSASIPLAHEYSRKGLSIWK